MVKNIFRVHQRLLLSTLHHSFILHAEFQAGYREGITAGKQSALQEGFDDGYANVGAPLGRKLGLLLGLSSSILSLLTSPSYGLKHEHLLNEMRDIAMQLSNVRLTDIAPPDLEAEAHERLHLEESNTPEMEVHQSAEVPSTETDGSPESHGRPTVEDITHLWSRLEAVIGLLGFAVDLD
jgi:hypothetical protein